MKNYLKYMAKLPGVVDGGGVVVMTLFVTVVDLVVGTVEGFATSKRFTSNIQELLSLEKRRHYEYRLRSKCRCLRFFRIKKFHLYRYSFIYKKQSHKNVKNDPITAAAALIYLRGRLGGPVVVIISESPGGAVC